MTLDKERLVKLLNMTGSSHDAEVLTAIRMSNDLLRQHKVTWADVLASPVRVEPVVVAKPAAHEHEAEPEPAPLDDPDFHTERPVYQPSGSYLEVDRARVEMRARIRSVHLIVRVLFFPIWAVAETYVTAVYRETSVVAYLMGLLVCLTVAGVTGSFWYILVVGLAGSFK